MLVKSQEPNGEVLIRYAKRVAYMPAHIDGAPVLFIDQGAHWTGTHTVYNELGAFVHEYELGAATDATRAATTTYYERLKKAI
jgi:hypothetical protein